MSSSNALVDQAGTIRNIKYNGFTQIGAWGELIDNSNDAGAKEVRIGLFKWIDEDGNTHYGYYIADDASGMNKEKLSLSCKINNPQDGENQSFGDKSGRFGIGGSSALIVISKTPREITKISRSSESRQIFAVEVIYEEKNQQTLPTARPLTRHQEDLWTRLAVRSSGTGTLIIGEVDETTYVEIHHLMSDKTMKGLFWYIATTFCRKIEAGLTISICASDDAAAPSVVVTSFNSLGSLDDTRITRESHQILILKDKTTGEFRFGERDPCDAQFVLSLPLDKPAKVNTKPKSLCLASYDVVGVVQIDLAFSQEWDKIHGEQTRGQFDTGKLANFREKTIARQYTRSGRCVISFPTPKRKQGDKAAYPFYENVIQEITMHATEVSDNLFGVVINKSQLDETKIDTELKKLIDHLRNVFSDRLYKKNVPEAERKKKSRLSDDATSFASDDTESVFDDDVLSLSSSMSVRSYARRTSASSLLPDVTGVAAVAGGGGDATVKQTKKTAISSTVSSRQKSPEQEQQQQQNDDVAIAASSASASASASAAAPEQPPVISNVPSHTALRITRSTGLGYLTALYEKQYSAQILVLIDELIREQQDRMSRTQVDVFLMFMQPADKYRMLTHLLERGSSDDFMKGGSALYNMYHQYYSE